MTIPRREFLAHGTLLAGGVLLGISACTQDRRAAMAPGDLLSPSQLALLTDIADTILPDTSASPGARAAGIANGLALLVNDCLPVAERRTIALGLDAVEAAAQSQFSAGFQRLTAADRTTLLTRLDRAAIGANESHWFNAMHDVISQSYFATEVGATKARRHVAVPGRFDGCVTRTPNQPAWA